MAMSPGDGAEAGSGEKLALRLALAAFEYRQQPIVRQWVSQIDEAREKLAGRIRQTLANALPTSDLDALGKGIDLLGTAAADLPSLMERIHGAIEHGRVEVLLRADRPMQEAIETLGLELRQTYLPKFRKAVPDVKVVRYYQIENKINAALIYELAAEIPLIKGAK